MAAVNAGNNQQQQQLPPAPQNFNAFGQVDVFHRGACGGYLCPTFDLELLWLPGRPAPPPYPADDKKPHVCWKWGYLILYILLVVLGLLLGSLGNILFYPLTFLTAGLVVLHYRKKVAQQQLDGATLYEVPAWEDMFRVFSHTFFGGSALALIVETVLSLILILIFYDKASKLSKEDYSELKHYPFVHVYIFLTAFVVAGVTEESVKALMMTHGAKLYLPHSLYINRNMAQTYVWFGLMAGLGFGTVEGVLYVCVYAFGGGGGSLVGQLILWLIRALLAIPFHTTTGILWGIHYARREVRKEEMPWWKMGYKQILWHGFYDFIEMELVVLVPDTILMVVLVLAIAVVLVVGCMIHTRLEYRRLMIDLQMQHAPLRREESD